MLHVGFVIHAEDFGAIVREEVIDAFQDVVGTDDGCDNFEAHSNDTWLSIIICPKAAHGKMTWLDKSKRNR